MRAKQPSGRFIAAEDVAGLMVFLCGPGSRDINGAALADRSGMGNRMNIDIENLRSGSGKTNVVRRCHASAHHGSCGYTRSRRFRSISCRRFGTGSISCRFIDGRIWGRTGIEARRIPAAVPLPRRMWAGGRVKFQHPCTWARRLPERRRSRMCSPRKVAVDRWYSCWFGMRSGMRRESHWLKEHDIVYRDLSVGGTGAPAPAPDDAVWQRFIRPTMCCCSLLGPHVQWAPCSLRSAVRDRSGRYPGLVVHGPLIATLLVETGAIEPASGKSDAV